MAHHQYDGPDLAGDLRSVRAQGRIRAAAVRPEQGDRPDAASLVRCSRAEHPWQPRGGVEADQRSRGVGRNRLRHCRSGCRHRARMAAHPGQRARCAADGGGNCAARLAGNRPYAGARAADRLGPAADGTGPISDGPAALPIDGACHDRTSRRRSRRSPRASQGRARGPDEALARDPQRRAARARPRIARRVRAEPHGDPSPSPIRSRRPARGKPARTTSRRMRG